MLMIMEKEKAKAYDQYGKALELAKTYYKSTHFRNTLDVLETIFPELKESEEERIRKELITHCRNIKCVTEEGAEKIVKWITWLEKQGEHANFCNKIRIGDRVTRNEAGVLVNISQLNRVAKPRVAKSTDKAEPKDYNSIDPHFAKPVDKVEPKFHEGDWVVVSTSGGDKVVQIDSVEYFKDGHPSYITTEGRWFGNGTKARLLTDKDVETITLPESKVIVERKPANLEKFINELSKQFPDVSFAKLSRIAVRVAKWAKPTDEEMKELLRTEYEKGRADTIAEMQKKLLSIISKE